MRITGRKKAGGTVRWTLIVVVGFAVLMGLVLVAAMGARADGPAIRTTIIVKGPDGNPHTSCADEYQMGTLEQGTTVTGNIIVVASGLGPVKLHWVGTLDTAPENNNCSPFADLSSAFFFSPSSGNLTEQNNQVTVVFNLTTSGLAPATYHGKVKVTATCLPPDSCSATARVYFGFTIANVPPTVTLTGGPYSGNESMTVTCNAGPISASHTYADNGAYTITVTVTDTNGGTGSGTSTANIANVAPTATLSVPSPVNEGDSFAVTLTDPFDPSSADTAAGFKYAFGCDGTLGPLGSGSSTTCFYPDGTSNHIVVAEICDKDGGCSTYSATVHVNNVGPTVDAAGPYSGTEGSPVTISATCTDPGVLDAPWSAVVLWGDGTSDSMTVTCSPIGASHVFADNGVYTITVTVTDKDGGVGTDTGTVNVANVPPSVDAGGPYSGNEGSPVAITISCTDPGVNDGPWSATVAWGDGSSTTTSITCNADHISPAHTYADNGAYTITATVTDKDGGVGSHTSTANIANVPPTAGAIGAKVTYDLTIRIAGPPGNVVCLFVQEDGQVVGQTCLSTEHNREATMSFDAELTSSFSAFLTFHAGGEKSGTTHVWLVVDGKTTKVATFVSDKKDPSTWDQTQEVAGFAQLFHSAGKVIRFSCAVGDVGADTLTATWTFGDGGTSTQTFQGPGTFDATAQHTYRSAGNYTVTLTVMDDDGGFAVSQVVLVIT